MGPPSPRKYAGVQQKACRSATFVAGTSAVSRSTKPNRSQRTHTHVCSHGFRLTGAVACEHMFCSHRTSELKQRARNALALARAFLLLEDDDPVDWEVDREERAAASREPVWAPAHRASLRGALLGGRRTPRRGGQPAAPPQVCLSPTRSVAARRATGSLAPRGSAQRGSRITTGSSRVAIDL